MGEDHPTCVGVLDVDVGGDLERAPADVDSDRLGDFQGVRVIDVPVAGRSHLRPWGRQDRDCGAVIQRQAEVLASLDVPQCLQLLDQLRVLVGQVVDLGPVLLDVVQRPLVVLEVTPAGWGSGVQASAFQPSRQIARVPSIT
jgi:hypothetical protein